MRILVVDKSIFWGKLKGSSESLLKHLEYWHAGNNKIDLLAKPDGTFEKRFKGKVNPVKLPRIPFLNSIYSIFYLMLIPRYYDLVVEIWEKRPALCLLMNKRRSLIFVYSSNYKNILPGKLLSRIYKNTRFLVNSHSVENKLLKAGIEPDSIKFLPDGNPIGRDFGSSRNIAKKKNKITVVSGNDVGSAISVASLVERKSLDWKFVVMTDKKNAKNFKNEFRKSGLTSIVKIIPLAKDVLNVNLSNSKFLVVTRGVKNISDYASIAFMHNTPVLIEGSYRDITEIKLQGLILKYENCMDVAAKILDLSKSQPDYLKLHDRISKSSENHTWDEVGRLSLKYIETL